MKQKAALALKQDPSHSIREICQIVGISRNTYYKYLKRAQEQATTPQVKGTKRKSNPAAHQVI